MVLKFSYAVNYLAISSPLSHISEEVFVGEGGYNTKANFKRRNNHGFN